MTVERPVVEPLRFEEDHRVVVLDRGDQQSLGVVRVRDDDGLQPGHVGEQRLRALAVRLAAVDASAGRHPDDERRREVAGRAVPQAGGFRHDLVVGGIHVVGELDLDARPQPVRRHADRGADDARLVDRGVEAAVLAEPLLQPLRAAEHAAEVADVLAEHDDAVVTLHRDRVGVTDRLDHRHRRHQSPTCSRCSRRCRGISWNTSSNIVRGLGITPLFIEPCESASANAASTWRRPRVATGRDDPRPTPPTPRGAGGAARWDHRAGTTRPRRRVGRRTGSSDVECAPRRSVTHSISVGPRLVRARSAAHCDAAYTAR